MTAAGCGALSVHGCYKPTRTVLVAVSHCRQADQPRAGRGCGYYLLSDICA